MFFCNVDCILTLLRSLTQNKKENKYEKKNVAYLYLYFSWIKPTNIAGMGPERNSLTEREARMVGPPFERYSSGTKFFLISNVLFIIMPKKMREEDAQYH